jgi:hypothetical protein
LSLLAPAVYPLAALTPISSALVAGAYYEREYYFRKERIIKPEKRGACRAPENNFHFEVFREFLL